MKKVSSIYVLIIQVSEDIIVQVGALGKKVFKKGLYAYVGSAQTNIIQRLKRHLRSDKRKFWHIDYLLDNNAAGIVKIFFRKANKTEECKTAKALYERNKPIIGFGCSDCSCKSHLFHINDYGLIRENMHVFPVES